MVKLVALATLLAASLGLVHGNAAGPPVTACGTMTPGHGTDAQTVVSPYTVTVSKATYHSGEQLTVTVTSATETAAFKGILLQARNTVNGPAVGSWTTSTGYKLLGCDSSATSALSHSSETEKRFPQSFTWTASASSSGPINFYATVVKKYDTFWVKTPSSAVSYVPTTTATGQITAATKATTQATGPTIAKVTTQATGPSIAKVTTKSTTTTKPTTNTTTSSSNKVVISVHVCVLIVSLICLVIR